MDLRWVGRVACSHAVDWGDRRTILAPTGGMDLTVNFVANFSPCRTNRI
jgi:hypothetical protein